MFSASDVNSCEHWAEGTRAPPNFRLYLLRVRERLSECREDAGVELAALQIAEQRHRHLLGLKPRRCEFNDLIVGDAVDSPRQFFELDFAPEVDLIACKPVHPAFRAFKAQQHVALDLALR